jgi:hypothetical protein
MRASGFVRRLTIPARLTGLAGLVAIAVAVGPPAAGASGSPGWRIVSTVGSKSSQVGNGDIVVTGPADAWTTWTCGPCPAGSQPKQNLMLHWNGKSWQPVDLPSQLRYPTVIAGEQASSANNFWVFINDNRADVFNGSGWTLKELPSWVERPIDGDDVSLAGAAFSPADVWAFSIDAQSEPTLAGHYYDNSWHKVELPVIPNTADGIAANDIWLYGFAKNYGPRTLAHYNGTSWQTVSLPGTAKGATLVASEMVALGAKSVWLAGELFPKSGKASSVLLHWDGRWTTTDVPSSVGVVDQFASDGGGGFWIIASRTGAGGTTESQFVHYAGGHWDSEPIPTEDKLTSEPGVLASVPGSQSMWAIGFLVSGSTPEFGEILGYTDAASKVDRAGAATAATPRPSRRGRRAGPRGWL